MKLRIRDVVWHTGRVPRIAAATLQEHQEHTKQAIVDAYNALIAERDPRQVSLGAVAQRAGIARTAIYNYVSGKDELAAIAAAHAGDEVAKKVHEIVQSAVPTPERLSEIVTTLLASFADGPTRVALSGALSGPTDRTHRLWSGPYLDVYDDFETLLAVGARRGEFREFADTRLVVELLAGLIGAAATRLTNPDCDASTITEQTLDILLPALVPAAPIPER